MNIKLIEAKDSVYGINSYLAINGLQRVSIGFNSRETNHQEIGNDAFTATSRDPESTVSFEVTDTATLAPLFARMRYDYATQSYKAGNSADITTNVGISITEDDMQYMILDFVEQKKPGSVFTEASLVPNCYLTRFGLRLNADGVGSATFDFSGNLMIPVYKPYHKLQSYPATYVSATEMAIPAGWAVSSATHGLLGAMVNNIKLLPTDIEFDSVDTSQVNLTVDGQAKVGDLSAEDRLMVWAFAKTPGDSIAIDYVNAVRFVKADRINIWLAPATEVVFNDANRYLRVQSFDLTGDLARDELKEIAKNENGTSTFFWALRTPLNWSGTINILENTIHKWAELQGKTLNETATAASVDLNNVLDNSNFGDAKIVIEWYKYGSDAPLQRLTLGTVRITQYEGTATVGGRKEGVWSYTTNGEFLLEGLAD